MAYVTPDPEGHDFMAKSKDYVLVMHFNNALKGRLKGKDITEDIVVNAFQDYQVLKMREKDTNMVINFPSSIKNVRAN